MDKKQIPEYPQSGVVPYLRHSDQIHIVLVTSTGTGEWIIPKGNIEPGLTAAESAVKEALEEAGVIGEFNDTRICEYQYEKWGGICRVEIFPLPVTDLLDEWDESNFRERIIVPMDNAMEVVKPVLRPVLCAFWEYIKEISAD